MGEEITAPDFHIIGVGLNERVAWRQSAGQAIDEIHRQGGVAIAAHPTRKFWEGFNQNVVRELDGDEVMHALSFVSGQRGDELKTFYKNAEAQGINLAPVGSSDYHWFDGLGLARTYVFVRNNSEGEILDALRNGRTVVFDTDGTAYGKPELINLIQEQRLRARTVGPKEARENVTGLPGSTAAWFGLLGLVLFGRRKGRREA